MYVLIFVYVYIYMCVYVCIGVYGDRREKESVSQYHHVALTDLELSM